MPVIGRHKASQNADSSATHNLEVPGSSPGWSTLKIRELRQVRNSFSFLGEIQVKFTIKKLIGEIQ